MILLIMARFVLTCSSDHKAANAAFLRGRKLDNFLFQVQNYLVGIREDLKCLLGLITMEGKKLVYTMAREQSSHSRLVQLVKINF